MWMLYVLIELGMGAALACGICHWLSFALVSAFVLIGSWLNYRNISHRRIAIAAVVLLFFVLVSIDVMQWPGFRALILQVCLDMLWTILAWRSLYHDHLANRVQVGLISLLPLVCVAYSLTATAFMAFMLAYFLVWTSFLCMQALEVPKTGSVAIPTENASLPAKRQTRVFSGRFWFKSITILLLSLAIGSLLFLVVPRWGVETIPPVPGGGRTTGQFPDVALDRTGKINVDPTLVFTADVPELSGNYYWRVEVQTIFDGVRWRTGNSGNSNQPRSSHTQNADAYRVEFAHDWHDFKLPTLYGTTAVELPDDVTAPSNIRFYHDAAGVWYRWGWRRGQPLTAFDFWIDQETAAEELRFDSRDIWPTEWREKAQRDRLAAFAHQIAGNATSREEIARRIQSYLQSNYRYSLERPQRDEPVVIDFLFNQKFGHCEVFSTTMAVLLARLNVPVRNVTGFVSSEFREGQNYVRSAHAHSWVEVYLDETRGWTVFDPTPSGPAPVEINLLVRIDDWFSTYKTRDFYNWMARYGLVLLWWAMFAAVAGFVLYVLVGYMRRRLAHPHETWKFAWSLVESDCRRCQIDTSLEQWWRDAPPRGLRDVCQFAREYISACYRSDRRDYRRSERFVVNDHILSLMRRARKSLKNYRS